MQIIAIQDRQIKNHLAGLERLAERRKKNLEYHQFSILRPILASLVKFDVQRISSEMKLAARFLWLLLRLPLMKRSIIILGIAPYDIRIVLLCPFLARHHVYMHNSWPTWSPLATSPKPKYFGLTCKIWRHLVPSMAKGIFCVSQATADSIRYHYPNWPECTIVGHSIDESWIITHDELMTKGWSRNVVYVGRMVAEKGIEDLIKLATKLPDFQFHFVGSGPMVDTVLNAELPNTRCYGHVSSRSEMARIIDTCSIIAQPSKSTSSWTEAFGIGVLEGMARGLVPITTDSYGSLAVLGPGLRNLAVPQDDYVSQFLSFARSFDTSRNMALRVKSWERAASFSTDAIATIWESLLVRTEALA